MVRITVALTGSAQANYFSATPKLNQVLVYQASTRLTGKPTLKAKIVPAEFAALVIFSPGICLIVFHIQHKISNICSLAVQSESLFQKHGAQVIYVFTL